MKKEINWLDFVVGLGLMFPIALWCGYVASILWGWFMVPTLGVPPLSTVPAAGIILMVSFMHPTTTATTQEQQDLAFSVKMLSRALAALIVLGMGAIFNLWM